MRVAWLLLLAGCELDVVPAKSHATPPAKQPSASNIDAVADPQAFEVTVREYGTEAPIAGATVDLVQFPPCRNDAQVCPPTRRAIQTAKDGVMRASVSGPMWGIERISAPGYLTQCPVNDDRHHLTDADKKELASGEIFLDHTHYVCHLVPASALVVRDRAHAIAAARAEPEIAAWLRTHATARVVQVEQTAIQWEVRFETPIRSVDEYYAHGESDYAEARLVVVDQLDGSASVLGRWE